MSPGVERKPEASGDPSICMSLPYESKVSSSVFGLGGGCVDGGGGCVSAYTAGSAVCSCAKVALKSGSATDPLVSTSNRITMRVSGPCPGTVGAAPPMHVRLGPPL